jgi:hypothetical protein
MTVLTKEKAVGEVVVWETETRITRETKVVQTGQDLDVGDVCEPGTVATEKRKVTGAATEVQTITVGGTCSGGTLKLGITQPDGSLVWTDTIAWSATEATMTASVNAALDNVLGASEVVCATIADTASLAMVLTFSGSSYASLAQVPVHVDAAALTGASTVTVAQTTVGQASGAAADSVCIKDAAAVDEVQTIVFGGTPTGGTFTLSVLKQDTGAVGTTTALAYNASAATISTALNVVTGNTGDIVATGTTLPDQTITFTFSGGEYAGRSHRLISPDTALLTGGTPTAVAARTTTGKQRESVFLVRGPAIVDKSELDYNSTTEANVDAALAALGIETQTQPTYSVQST